MTIETRLLTKDDIEALVPLFDSYRELYEQSSNISEARRFLLERFENRDSSIIGAFSNNHLIGFTQLYPTFSSVQMRRKWILNDMFVVLECRRLGAAKALLQSAADFARDTKATAMVLSTASDNVAAQKVYEKNGWQRDQVFLNYNFKV